MSRLLTLSLMALLTLLLVLPASAKKHPATTTAPTTQPAPTKKGSDSAVETHKHRAKEFEGGKELDKGKTEGKVKTLDDQVSALDKKLKAQSEPPAETSSKHHKHHPATQPTTQETKKSEKSKK